MSNIICISAIRWDDMRQRIQHLMEGLSKNHKVIYINPAFDYSKAIKYKKQKGYFPKEFVRINENLHVISPILPFSIRKVQTLNKIVRKHWFSSKVVEYLEKLDLKKEDNIVFVSDIYAIDVLKDIPYSKLIYDCCDEVAEFSSSYKEVANSNEKYLIENADIVLTSAQKLYDRIVKENPNTYIVRNGVEYDHFYGKCAGSENGIGFIGALADWIDVEIMEYLAEHIPDTKLHIIGPVSVKTDNLKKFNNVVIYGKQDYAVLPELFKHFNVALLPFKINKLTLSVNPIKFYEYCAGGKVSVATRLPELENYIPHIYIADTKEEFCDMTIRALQQEDQSFIKEIEKIAKENSWQQRAMDVHKIINEKL